MRMPSGDEAWVPPEKLTGYLLDETHPDGGGKATLFRRLLGITIDDAETLETALLDAARSGEVTDSEPTLHGKKHRIDFPMSSGRGTYTVVSVWITPGDDPRPRLVTAYVK